ncbi:MAG: DUF4058 family protein [Chroococcidiopsidaceae cyanobacterium CP_BM_RX_35]|nr:DUF4058 family protein [Chroococcidiopsidaceae cyanobacterium CP_BM_RX_35]
MPQFPGMNPYLEGHLFPDLHNALTSRIRALLTPLLRPRYAVRLEIYTVQDTNIGEELGIVYPDVEVFQTSQQVKVSREAVAVFTPATLTLPLPISVRVPKVDIRDVESNRLVTCIEILSFVNKRQPGLDFYTQKRDRLLQARVNLVEIDLLRRGMRLLNQPQIPASHYRMSVTRSYDRTEVWAVQMQDRLPTIPIPLLPSDTAVPLDLSKAIQTVYKEADYDLTINYTRRPPIPKLSQADTDWLQALLES